MAKPAVELWKRGLVAPEFWGSEFRVQAFGV